MKFKLNFFRLPRRLTLKKSNKAENLVAESTEAFIQICLEYLIIHFPPLYYLKKVTGGKIDVVDLINF